ncbi:hypothetical protein GCM10023339_41070 [Alloalcanivorax gelatiniphagus]
MMQMAYGGSSSGNPQRAVAERRTAGHAAEVIRPLADCDWRLTRAEATERELSALTSARFPDAASRSRSISACGLSA